LQVRLRRLPHKLTLEEVSIDTGAANVLMRTKVMRTAITEYSSAKICAKTTTNLKHIEKYRTLKIKQIR